MSNTLKLLRFLKPERVEGSLEGEPRLEALLFGSDLDGGTRAGGGPLGMGGGLVVRGSEIVEGIVGGTREVGTSDQWTEWSPECISVDIGSGGGGM